jgi:predicted RecA/RadA family phage recombinase
MEKETRYIQDGKRITYKATEHISVGDIVPLSDMVGVAFCSAMEGEDVTLMLDGVFEIAKDGDISVGQKVYFDTTARKATPTETDIYIGKAISVSSSVVNVKINI